MLIHFLQNLKNKPEAYQLFWVHVLGHLKNGKTTTIKTSELKLKFNFSRMTFYRVMNYGLDFFNDETKEIHLYLNSRRLVLSSSSNQKESEAHEHKKIDIIEDVINYLNEKAEKKFTTKNKATIKIINARIKEGFSIDDFKKVIDVKCFKWKNTDMNDYLRPQTLFSQKMEGYLNEKIQNTNGNKRFTSTQSAVDEAKSIDWFSKK